jgi:peptidoglycan-N-acetylglucosamine deacetylase
MENRSEFFGYPRSLTAAVTVIGFLGMCMVIPGRLADPKLPIHKNGKIEVETVTRVFSVPPQFQGKVFRDVELDANEKAIALTFDDGPAPTTTPQVLKILRENNIKGTFFWIGVNLQKHPDIARQVVADGHAIGNHTWHHWYFRMNPATAAAEVENTNKLIQDATGVKTVLFRPPGGYLHNGLVGYARRQNYAIAMWSSEPGEFFPRNTVSAYVRNVLNLAQPGGIVLMHDIHPKSVQALPLIITALRQRGYKFVTIPELLEMEKEKTPPPNPQTPVAND